MNRLKILWPLSLCHFAKHPQPSFFFLLKWTMWRPWGYLTVPMIRLKILWTTTNPHRLPTGAYDQTQKILWPLSHFKASYFLSNLLLKRILWSKMGRHEIVQPNRIQHKFIILLIHKLVCRQPTAPARNSNYSRYFDTSDKVQWPFFPQDWGKFG